MYANSIKGLKLNPNKCRFFKREQDFLEHVILEKGIASNGFALSITLTFDDFFVDKGPTNCMPCKKARSAVKTTTGHKCVRS